VQPKWPLRERCALAHRQQGPAAPRQEICHALRLTRDLDVALGQQPLGQVELELLPQGLVDAGHGFTQRVAVVVVESTEGRAVDLHFQRRGKGLSMVPSQPGHRALGRTFVRVGRWRCRCLGLAAALLVLLAAAARARLVATQPLCRLIAQPDLRGISAGRRRRSGEAGAATSAASRRGGRVRMLNRRLKRYWNSAR
jgi:hypothetical protein